MATAPLPPDQLQAIKRDWLTEPKDLNHKDAQRDIGKLVGEVERLLPLAGEQAP